MAETNSRDGAMELAKVWQSYISVYFKLHSYNICQVTFPNFFTKKKRCACRVDRLQMIKNQTIPFGFRYYLHFVPSRVSK